jgi:acyl-CoA synthetase (AMP-forming)/AMP-acid ligase II
VWNTPEGIQIAFNVVPVYHTLGLYITSFFHFLSRATIVMLHKWNTDVFFDSIPK